MALIDTIRHEHDGRSWLALKSYQRLNEAGEFEEATHTLTGAEGEAYWYSSGRGYDVLEWEPPVSRSWRFPFDFEGGWATEISYEQGVFITLTGESERYVFEQS